MRFFSFLLAVALVIATCDAHSVYGSRRVASKYRGSGSSGLHFGGGNRRVGYGGIGGSGFRGTGHVGGAGIGFGGSHGVGSGFGGGVHGVDKISHGAVHGNKNIDVHHGAGYDGVHAPGLNHKARPLTGSHISGFRPAGNSGFGINAGHRGTVGGYNKKAVVKPYGK